MNEIRCRAAVVLTLATMCLAPAIDAQTATVVHSPNAWVTHTDSSVVLRERRAVRVVTPAGYDTATRSYPVLVLLDAHDDLQFRAAVANVAYLSAEDALPPLLIVGIENARNRTRDLTPDTLANPDGRLSGGGGDRFLEYIRQELMPMVSRTYRTAPYVVFAGHSFGGLLAVHVAASYPTLAQAVIAMSPSLWVNGEQATPRFVHGIASRTTGLRFFTTRGAFEPGIDTSTARFEKRLRTALRQRSNTVVAFEHRRYDFDSHDVTPPASLVDGLRWVFRDYSFAELGRTMPGSRSRLDSAGVERAVRASEGVIRRSEAAFPPALLGATPGPTGVMPASRYVQLVPALTALRQPGAGISIFGRALAAYPYDPRLHSAMAIMRLARGDTVTAIADLQKAIALSQASADAVLKSQLEAQLGMIKKAKSGS